MGIEVIAVGRIKESYLKEGIKEYEKRIRAFSDIKITELKDEPTPEGEKEKQKVKETEGKRILDAIKSDSFVIALEIKGLTMTSEELSKKITNLKLEGKSNISFVIGGSIGLSDEVLSRADLKLSFSKFTFPHKLMRLILIEQIYRALSIEKGLPYHK